MDEMVKERNEVGNKFIIFNIISDNREIVFIVLVFEFWNGCFVKWWRRIKIEKKVIKMRWEKGLLMIVFIMININWWLIRMFF